MSKTAITSGGAGDIIISVPVMQKIGITTLLVKESFYPPGYGSMYSAMKDLIELQGIAVLPTKDEGKGFDQFEAGVRFDVSMDAWRGMPGRGIDFIGSSMAWWFKSGHIDFRRPWLTVDDIPTYWTGLEYTLWFLSPRWRQSDCDWRKIFASVEGLKLFVGFREDCQEFASLVGQEVEFVHSDNFLYTARLVRDATAVYCNQSAVLALSMGLGKDYYCAFKKGKTNCRLYTKNEHPL